MHLPETQTWNAASGGTGSKYRFDAVVDGGRRKKTMLRPGGTPAVKPHGSLPRAGIWADCDGPVPEIFCGTVSENVGGG